MLESVVVVGARAIAPTIGKQVAKLARSLLFRWRVDRRVARAVGFYYPRRRFRRWLKDIAPELLRRPIEDAVPEIVRSLGELFATDLGWLDSESNSRILILAEKLYEAITLLAEPEDARVLSESWASHRHGELVRTIVASIPSLAVRLSSEDHAGILRLQSLARSEVRLRPFGQNFEFLREEIGLIGSGLPSLDAGGVRILVGPFGSGKSEAAENWHLTSVEAYASDPTSAVPVWLHAAELRSTALSQELERRVDVETMRARGVDVVIDGCDEVETSLAVRLAEQADAMVRTTPNSRTLLTTRPGVFRPEFPGQHEVGVLTEEQSLALIQKVTAAPPRVWAFNASVRDAIKRPFFALAVALATEPERRTAGRADLISIVVKRALALPATGASFSDQDQFELLLRLARAATETDGVDDGLAFVERQRIRASRLVNERADGNVEFALPVFQQWFAGQAILEDLTLVATATSNSEHFDRWRWPLALAVAEARPDEKLDDLLELCVRANPAIASWLLSETSQGGWAYRESGDSLGTAPERRILRAQRAWLDALGDLAPKFFPISASSAPVRLGVAVDGHRLWVGWDASSGGEEDTVVVLDLEEERNFRNHWAVVRSGTARSEAHWPWTLAIEPVKRNMLSVLNRSADLGPLDGVWDLESQYRAARIIARRRDFRFRPIPEPDLTRALEAATRSLGPNVDVADVTFSEQGHRIEGVAVRRLQDRLRRVPIESIERPLPVPDPRWNPSQQIPFIMFSPEQALRFYAQLFGSACDAYDELAETSFSKFGWALGTRAHGPFGVACSLSYRDSQGTDFRSPSLTYVRLPLDLLSEAASTFDHDFTRADSGRALVSLDPEGQERGTSWVEELADLQWARAQANGYRTNPFATYGFTSTIEDFSRHSRAASQLSARWLFDDLKAISLADGTFPQLDD